MRRFCILLASAALGGVLLASGPVAAAGMGGHMGGGGGGGHMGGGFGGGGHMGGGFGGHFNGFVPGVTGRSAAIGRFDPRFGRIDPGDRFSFRRGFIASGFPLWGWGGGWGYPYFDNGYSGNNNPSSYNFYSTVYGATPLASGGSGATGQPGKYCVISVKTCQLHTPSFVGNDCSCKVPGGATSDVP